MKEITREEMDVLVKNGVVKSSGDGMVTKNGSVVSYMRTKHKQYIADEYVNLAHKLAKGSNNGKEKVKK